MIFIEKGIIMGRTKSFAFRIKFLYIYFFLNFFSGCGGKEECEGIQYYDIVSDVDSIFAEAHMEDVKGVLLGMQYYQGDRKSVV